MRKFGLATLAILMFTFCTPEREDPFLVGTDRVGKLLKSHSLSDLSEVYRQDSLVRDTTRMAMGPVKRIEVYEPGGRHLLTLTPAKDTVERVGNVHIRDPRFKTESGIGLESTFGDIEKAYEVKKVVSSLKNILVLVKGHPVYFTISREALPPALRYTDASIEAVQIPDGAPIKYMMVGWE